MPSNGDDALSLLAEFCRVVAAPPHSYIIPSPATYEWHIMAEEFAVFFPLLSYRQSVIQALPSEVSCSLRKTGHRAKWVRLRHRIVTPAIGTRLVTCHGSNSANHVLCEKGSVRYCSNEVCTSIVLNLMS